MEGRAGGQRRDSHLAGQQELGQREPDKTQGQANQTDYKVEEIQAAALAQVAEFLQQAADQGRSIEEVIGQVKSNADRIQATIEGDPGLRMTLSLFAP